MELKPCVGCRHIDDAENGDWCYLFKVPPTTLPCGQHDKFANERKALGKLIQKYPPLLTLLLMGMEKENP